MAARQLVASVGVGDLKEVTYRLDSEPARGVHSTRFAPVALARLLGLSGCTATILVTQKAHDKWYEQLARELEDVGLRPEPVLVPEGRSEDEILSTLGLLVDRVPDDTEVILDVTFSLRHLPFVYLAALAYLTGLRKARIGGIYYGAYELREGGVAPILEISSLLQMIEWHRPLRTARAAGDFSPVAFLIREDVKRLFGRGVRDIDLSAVKSRAESLAVPLATGLPLEMGIRARRLLDAAAKLDSCGVAAPKPARLAVELLRATVEPMAVEDAPESKAELRLTLPELERELRVARFHQERGNVHAALLILREWLVNALLLWQGRAADWLDYGKARSPAERVFTSLSLRNRQGLAKGDEEALASLWDSISTPRNRHAHAGMCPDEVPTSPAAVESLIESCKALLVSPPSVALPVSAAGRLLLTPLGLSPGVFFSAVHRVAPEGAIVVTSSQARERAAEALSEAGRPDLPTEYVLVADPHNGFAEGTAIASRPDLHRRLVEAAEVVVNITGGTTALQYIVDRLADQASRLGTPVRRIALVDRRSPEDQRARPYVLGEYVPLDVQAPQGEGEGA